MIEIYGVKLSDTMTNHDSDYQLLLDRASAAKRDRAARFLQFADAQRTIVCDILIRTLIAAKYGLPNSDIHFSVNEFGKPFLQSGIIQQEFNLSHSGDWCVCALDSQPLGIDIEQVKPIQMDIARRFFTEQEIDYIQGNHEIGRLQRFFSIWTLKESYIKAIGHGMSIPLDSFTITPEEEPSGHFNLVNTDVDTPYYFRQYEVEGGYKLSVCAQNTQFPDYICLKSLKQLCEETHLLL